MLYGFGFLAVAYNPVRHSGIVLMGGLGKAFVALFILHFLRLRHHGYSLLWGMS